MIRTTQKIKMIPLKEILPNPYQARRKFCHTDIEKLAESIKEVGILSPLIVRRSNFGFELICGQRRLRAAVIAGLEEIPAIIVRAGDAQCAQLSIIENLHRKNLGIFEEAESFYNLMMFHRIKKEKLQKSLSVSPFFLNDRIRILSLRETVRKEIENCNLPETIIKELLRLHNEEKQIDIIKRIKEENLSPEDVRKLISSNLINMSQKQKKRRISDINKEKNCQREPIYINTVRKTVELLKSNGAKVEYSQNETEKYTEFIIKAYK